MSKEKFKNKNLFIYSNLTLNKLIKGEIIKPPKIAPKAGPENKRERSIAENSFLSFCCFIVWLFKILIS